MNFKKLFSGPFIWIFAALAVLFIGATMIGGSQFKQVDTQVGLSFIEQGKAESVRVLGNDQRVDVVLSTEDSKYGKQIQFFYVQPRGAQVVDTIAKAYISKGYNDDVQSTPWILALLGSLIPFILIGAIFWFLMSGMGGGGGRGVMNFGKSRAKLVTKEQSKVTFADVAGSDEALEELQEIKEFLKEPKKFQDLGAKIPRGVLLYGPPGTGKTLVAKAVAGEAGVPFFAISGSDFVEMFVGVGASRVRDLFEQAKQSQNPWG